MVFGKSNVPSAYVRFRHQDFLSINWDLLAMAAYTFYLAHGAGLILVEEKEFMPFPSGVLREIPMRYVTATSPDYEEVLGPKEKAWLKDYDMTIQVLVGFARIGGGYSSYKINAVSPDRTPKALYERESCDNKNNSGEPETQPG